MDFIAEFEPKTAAKKLLRESRSGALASLMANSGAPYCSLVNVATLTDGSPLLLLSRLAVHTKNVLADQRVSLMLDERKAGDPLEGARIMLMGNIALADTPDARRRYLIRHLEAEKFVNFGDFNFYTVQIARAHLVAGFGRIVDLECEDIITNTAGADALVASEQDIIEHMNKEHADICSLFAVQLLGSTEKNDEWRCVGCDPEGLDLQNGRLALRLMFDERVNSPDDLRKLLKRLAEKARDIERNGKRTI